MKFLIDVKEKAAEFAEANAAALLTAGGVVGTVATAVLTGRATVGTYEKIWAQQTAMVAEAEAENAIQGTPDKELPKMDTKSKLLIAAPYFIPPVIVGTATIASIVMANRVSAQKAAALAAAYGLAERNLSEYKEKVAEKLTGPKKTAIDDELAQDRVNKADGYQNIVIIEGEVLCFDEPSGRYFRSTMENIKSAVNSTNAEILHHDHANATYFYDELGMEGTSWSDEVGWNTDNLLEIKYTTAMSPDGRPCISIDYKTGPKADYVPKHY